MNKYPCDRCGKPTHDESGEDWLDGAGNCEACGDDLCPECAGDWVAGGPYCERCSIQFMLDDAVKLTNSDEHFYLAREVLRLRKIIKEAGIMPSVEVGQVWRKIDNRHPRTVWSFLSRVTRR